MECNGLHVNAILFYSNVIFQFYSQDLFGNEVLDVEEDDIEDNEKLLLDETDDYLGR